MYPMPLILLPVYGIIVTSACTLQCGGCVHSANGLIFILHTCVYNVRTCASSYKVDQCPHNVIVIGCNTSLYPYMYDDNLLTTQTT